MDRFTQPRPALLLSFSPRQPASPCSGNRSLRVSISQPWAGRFARCFTRWSGAIFTIILYRPLICEKCALCGNFGGYLFLLTATRCCRVSPDLRVISASNLSKAANISINQLRQILGPELRTVPGTYFMEDKRVRCPKFMVVKSQLLKNYSCSTSSIMGQPGYC